MELSTSAITFPLIVLGSHKHLVVTKCTTGSHSLVKAAIADHLRGRPHRLQGKSRGGGFNTDRALRLMRRQGANRRGGPCRRHPVPVSSRRVLLQLLQPLKKSLLGLLKRLTAFSTAATTATAVNTAAGHACPKAGERPSFGAVLPHCPQHGGHGGDHRLLLLLLLMG